MKKARIILTAVALLAIVGGALAFKASRNQTPKLAIFLAGDDTFTTTASTIGTSVYTATIPYCVTTTIWRTPVGGQIVNTFSTTTNALTTVKATLVGGTATITFPYVYCTPFATRTTDVD